ncbi:hypothetical protein [Streptomyces sp. NPDC048603]|uniref:hypothetical protein n=1 Tax=Streptomyces sp. NPDC048603 TaxID=3365577 RepID=UPI003723510A
MGWRVRARAVAVGVWAVAALVGCSAGGDGGGVPGPDSPGRSKEAPAPVPSGSPPASASDSPSASASASAGIGVAREPVDAVAARAEVEENWALFFDGRTPAAERVRVLENGSGMAPLLARLEADPSATRTSAEVGEVLFTSPTEARVTYDLRVGGNPLLSGSKGTAVLRDGTWKVSARTLCELARSGGKDAPGC